MAELANIFLSIFPPMRQAYYYQRYLCRIT